LHEFLEEMFADLRGCRGRYTIWIYTEARACAAARRTPPDLVDRKAVDTDGPKILFNIMGSRPPEDDINNRQSRAAPSPLERIRC